MDVWLVEDDDLVSIPFTMWIERQGHTVTTFRRAQEVLDAIATQPAPALVITDMTMPGMDGKELITRVRAQAGPIPAILMSGHDLDVRALGIDQPFEFLPKPVDLDKLDAVIAAFTGV